MGVGRGGVKVKSERRTSQTDCSAGLEGDGGSQDDGRYVRAGGRALAEGAGGGLEDLFSAG